jgi:hypothetical protein
LHTEWWLWWLLWLLLLLWYSCPPREPLNDPRNSTRVDWFVCIYLLYFPMDCWTD